MIYSQLICNEEHVQTEGRPQLGVLQGTDTVFSSGVQFASSSGLLESITVKMLGLTTSRAET
jgi:hypothetical protein